MKTIYVILGFFFLGLGIVGIVLPVLPTTPFLLLTVYFFAKGSKKFHDWFVQTKLYKKHLESFIRDKTMTRKRKWILLIFVDIVIIISFIMVPIWWVRVILVLLVIIKYIYFQTQIKVI
jgi:uncharacterized membrane protein YbaN (DUF454 family)